MKPYNILLLISAVALGFYSPDILKLFSQQEAKLDTAKYCILSSQSCQQSNITMTLEHDTTKPLVPSELVVEWPNTTQKVLLLSLQGLEMDMGVAKYQLHKISDGRFSGTLLLPVCTQEGMTWVGTLTDGNKEVYPAIRMER